MPARMADDVCESYMVNTTGRSAAVGVPGQRTVQLRYARPVFRPRTGSAPSATYSSRTRFSVPVAGELLAIQLG